MEDQVAEKIEKSILDPLSFQGGTVPGVKSRLENLSLFQVTLTNFFVGRFLMGKSLKEITS